MSNCEKTADEMFRELGYTEKKDGIRWIVYSDKVSRTDISYDKELGIFSCSMDERDYGFSDDEILACAQLIREMRCADA